MSRKILAQYAYDRVKLVHGDNVTLDMSTFVKASSIARYIDKDYGEWWALLKTVLRGSRHTDFKCVNFKKSRLLTLDDLKQKIAIKHNDIVTLAPNQQYKTSHTKMNFVDKEFGLWSAMPYSVMCGHGHPNRGQREKARKSKFSIVLLHWKTGTDLVCTASYEIAVVSWLNLNSIDFDWQTPVRTPYGTYFIDLFIKDKEFANTWVEIKGTWSRRNGCIGKIKWEWFHENYPNSQLWMSDDLHKLKIADNDAIKHFRSIAKSHNM